MVRRRMMLGSILFTTLLIGTVTAASGLQPFDYVWHNGTIAQVKHTVLSCAEIERTGNVPLKNPFVMLDELEPLQINGKYVGFKRDPIQMMESGKITCYEISKSVSRQKDHLRVRKKGTEGWLERHIKDFVNMDQKPLTPVRGETYIINEKYKERHEKKSEIKFKENDKVEVVEVYGNTVIVKRKLNSPSERTGKRVRFNLGEKVSAGCLSPLPKVRSSTLIPEKPTRTKSKKMKRGSGVLKNQHKVYEESRLPDDKCIDFKWTKRSAKSIQSVEKSTPKAVPEPVQLLQQKPSAQLAKPQSAKKMRTPLKREMGLRERKANSKEPVGAVKFSVKDRVQIKNYSGLGFTPGQVVGVTSKHVFVKRHGRGQRLTYTMEQAEDNLKKVPKAAVVRSVEQTKPVTPVHQTRQRKFVSKPIELIKAGMIIKYTGDAKPPMIVHNVSGPEDLNDVSIARPPQDLNWLSWNAEKRKETANKEYAKWMSGADTLWEFGRQEKWILEEKIKNGRIQVGDFQ